MVDKHPAGVGRRSVWFGVEAEGLHKGKRVAILRSKPQEDDFLGGHEVEHFFLTEEFRDWDWVASHLIPLADRLGATIVAGVEQSQVENVLQLPIAYRIGIIARVWIDDFGWFTRLRPGDEVSVGTPFFMATCKVGEMVLSAPADYEGDTP